MTTATLPRPIADIIPAARTNWPDLPPDATRSQRAARPRLADMEITHPDLTAAITQVRAWGAAMNAARRQQNSAADETAPLPTPSLILSGPNGTGKTALARVIQWSMVNAVLDDDGKPIDDMITPACRWYVAADLLARLGNERDGDGYNYSAAPGQIVGSAPFVIIDDVAAELSIPFVAYPAQEAERQIRYYLFLDWCVNNRVPVILTTNLAAAGDNSALAQHVGPRAWSRLMQMCPRGYIVSLWSVPDYRRRVGGR